MQVNNIVYRGDIGIYGSSSLLEGMSVLIHFEDLSRRSESWGNFFENYKDFCLIVQDSSKDMRGLEYNLCLPAEFFLEYSVLEKLRKKAPKMEDSLC